MGGLMTVDEAFHRLLHSRRTRTAFIAGRVDALAVSPETLSELRTVDHALLEEVAERIASQVLTRGYSATGSLPELFPRTVAAFRAAHPDAGPLELAYRFLESEAFGEYRELPFSGVGLSLEEAFYRFAEAEDLGTAADRGREFHAALMKLVAVNPRAAVKLPACLRTAPGGHFMVTTHHPATLHAAVGKTLVSGPLTPFLADLLAEGADPEDVARRHRVSADVLRKSVAHFATLGLLPAPDVRAEDALRAAS
ncbi:MAG TPA: hypothetical protein VHE30_15445 [Polyangiaceae bacterium]|nr:hypothetical protein [Polyangiaceae bacterium]